MEEVWPQTAATQALFDRSVALWTESYTRQGGTIFCGKGCRECCNLAVNCTFPEAVEVARALTPAHREKLAERVKVLAERLPQMTDLKSFLRMHRRDLGFCPFLEADGACGIYAVRPLSCRSLLATKESRWCAVDFSDLGSDEKRAFVESLDRSVAAFPMHYVGAMQDLASELEAMLAQRMREKAGFALYGNLPALVWLEAEYRLSEKIAAGHEAVAPVIAASGLLHPFLIVIDRREP